MTGLKEIIYDKYLTVLLRRKKSAERIGSNARSFPAWLTHPDSLLSSLQPSQPCRCRVPRYTTSFPASGPVHMLYLLACEACALSQSFFNSRLRCHQVWEAFPSPQAVTPVPLSEHLRCGQDTLHGPALLSHGAVHAAKTGPGASLALVAGGLAHCLLACGRPMFREGISE